jgi:hypothetical protein
VADVTRAWLIFSESAEFPAGREYDSRCGLERGPASDGAIRWFAVWHFFEHEGISFKKSPCRQWEWHRSLVSFCAAAIYAVMSAMGQKQT